MTNEESENNKLIALFMGATTGRNTKDGTFYYLPDAICSYLPSELKYHSSYDWLIPVTVKIETITDDFHGHFDVVIYSNSCTIQGSKFDDRPATLHLAYFNQEYADTKMQAVYAAVVAFIKWYNSITQ